MYYYITTTYLNVLSINYLYYEYVSNEEVYELNSEYLLDNPNTNITYYAGI